MIPEEVLQKYFSFSEFRPGQQEIINSILDGSNVLAVLPTGAGKSICYQIPALMGGNYSIVISPLIALMKDQVDAINKHGKSAAYLNSSLSFNQARDVLNDLSNGSIKILFVAPERLENSEFTNLIKNNKPDYLFVDEAHCISEWGHNFRPSYRHIKSFCETTGIEKISAFTATANPEVQDDIIEQLDFKRAAKFIRGFERSNIAINILKESSKKEICTRILQRDQLPAIVYTATRKLSEDVSEFLQFKKFSAAAYHAGLGSDLRKMIQDDFINDRTDIIVATNAFGMGIDKPNIRAIIHYNMPASIENYYQEFGRAGRDEKDSNVYLLFSPRDKAIQKFFVENSYPTETDIRMTYNMICDYGKTALGSTKDESIKLDEGFMKLLNLNKMNRIKLLHAINVLVNSGYLHKPANIGNRYGVSLLLQQARIKKFIESESNATIKDFILLLIKEYGYTVIDSRVNINPGKFSRTLDVPEENLIELARWLHNAGIIEFSEPHEGDQINIAGTRIKAQNLQLNTASIEHLIDVSKRKLQSIMEFVNSNECRFKYIINYFGEDADNYSCGKCDNCRGVSGTETESLAYLKDIIIETLHELKTPIKSRDLINLLLGHSNHPGIRKATNFGRIEHFNKTEISEAILDLTANEFIEDFDSVVKLTDKANSYILKEGKKDASNESSEEFNSYLQIYNKLKEVREFAAKKFSQVPEVICSDRILQETARSLPSTPTQLMQINGFTQRHFNKLGDEIIEIIKEYKKESEVKSKLNEDIPEHSFKVYDLVRKRYSLEDIVSFTKLPEAVVSMQIESLIEIDHELDILSLIDKDETDAILEKIKSGDRNLKSIKSDLPSSISYGKIRIMLAKSRYGEIN